MTHDDDGDEGEDDDDGGDDDDEDEDDQRLCSLQHRYSPISLYALTLMHRVPCAMLLNASFFPLILQQTATDARPTMHTLPPESKRTRASARHIFVAIFLQHL